MADTNKQSVVPVVGLEKLYVAEVTKDDITGAEFATPQYFAGIKKIGIKPKVTIDEFFAENTIWDTDSTLASIDVELDVAGLTDEEEAFLLGHKLAQEGGVIYSTTDIAPDVALLFKANKSNGKGRYVTLYKGKFSIADEAYKGKEGKANFQSKKLKASFAPLHFNQKWKYKVDEDSSNAPVDLDTKWFEKVIMPTVKTTK